MNASEIKSIRELLNLNQLQFAQLLGVHPITVSKWERGIATPTDYQQAFMSQFQVAAKNKKAREELKTVLIVAGVITALAFLFQAASKK
jgi:putative transcriptional regulator